MEQSAAKTILTKPYHVSECNLLHALIFLTITEKGLSKVVILVTTYPQNESLFFQDEVSR